MAAKRAGGSGTLRIIGGRWRGRKLSFDAAPGLRPTPDRVRETLFNWLAADIAGARCLDLFAGSGALGLEALSRGAGYCLFVDAHGPSLRSVDARLQELACENAATLRADAGEYLARGPGAEPGFDIVFLDPPFNAGMLAPTCAALEQHGWLTAGARIYLESGAREALPQTPQGWELLRDKRAGDVCYRLFVRPG